MSIPDYNDYIVFQPQKEELDIKYVRVDDIYIKVSTNKMELLCEAFDKRSICDICNKERVIGSITIIYDKYIFIPRYDYHLYDENSFVSKQHPMYIEGVNNRFFEINNLQMHLYHYPYELFNYYDKERKDYYSVVSIENEVINELICGAKKILSRYFFSRNIYSLHGAAVYSNRKGYVFLSGSRVGKSSLYVNLLQNGYNPINDDIVFWGVENENIKLFSCNTMPRLRENCFNDVTPSKKLGEIMNNNSKDAISYIIAQKNYNSSNEIVLDKIFIPEIGHDKTEIFQVKSQDYYKKILRSCMIHGIYEVDEDFLYAFKKLNTIKTYKINMSNNYEEICDVFNNFIEDYS